MRIGLVLLGFLGFVGFFATFVLEQTFQSRAKLVQFVHKRPDLLATGQEGYVRVGTPQLMVLDDKQAFLSGFGDQGALLADMEYMSIHKLSPLPISTLQSIAFMARVGALVSVLIAIVGYRTIPRSFVADD